MATLGSEEAYTTVTTGTVVGAGCVLGRAETQGGSGQLGLPGRAGTVEGVAKELPPGRAGTVEGVAMQPPC